MARRKPLDQLSPAYRKRIESAERRGLTRQQARGHAAVMHGGSERKARQSALRERAVRDFALNYELRHENHEKLFDSMLLTYTLAGILPMLRAREAAHKAWLYHGAGSPESDAAREKLSEAHDRYRRKRRPERSVLRTYGVVDDDVLSDADYDDILPYDDIDFDTSEGEPVSYAVFLFYH